MAVRLNWIEAETNEVLEPGLVLEGKQVILRDNWLGWKKPDEVTIYQEEGRLGRVLRNLKGLPPNSSSFLVREEPAGSGISEAKWRTKVGSLTTMQTIWRFRDKVNDAWSGPLTVTPSHGGALITVESEGGGPVPVDVEGEYAGAKPGIKTKVPAFDTTRKRFLSYVSVTDPTVSTRLLVPWEHGTNGLLEFLVEQESGIEADSLTREFAKTFGQSVFAQPKGLEVRIEEPTFEVRAGERHDLYLIIEAHSTQEDPTYITVAASINGNSAQTVLSDLIEVAVTETPVRAAVT